MACAACGERAEGEYSIHRDGFGVGPEVPLCNACGREETPTCDDLWRRIAKRLAAGQAPGATGQEKKT